MIGVVKSMTPPIYKIKMLRRLGQCQPRRFDSTWLFYCVAYVDVMSSQSFKGGKRMIKTINTENDK